MIRTEWIGHWIAVGSLVCLLLFGGNNTLQGQTHGDWADEPANLTVGEYLDIIFQEQYKRPEGGPFNSDFSLVSFYPSNSPDNAIVVIIQTWDDRRVTDVNLRREIRQDGDATVRNFNSNFRLPRVSKRWRPANPEDNLVIRHVRVSDLSETIAVTIGGTTHFDDPSITRARELVEERGGVWTW